MSTLLKSSGEGAAYLSVHRPDTYGFRWRACGDSSAQAKQ